MTAGGGGRFFFSGILVLDFGAFVGVSYSAW